MKIKIEKIIYPGKSLAREKGKIIFTDHGLPDEELEVKITRQKKDYSEVSTIKVISPSEYRILPRCKHHYICAAYQYIEYSRQIIIKQQQLKEIFQRALKENAPSSILLKACPSPWHYRNKIHLHIVWQNNIAYYAYHQNKSHNKFIIIDHCLLCSEKINLLLGGILRIVNQNKISHIEEIIIRESRSKDQLLFCLLGTSNSKNLFRSLKQFSCLKTNFPISGITYLNKKTKTERTIFGRKHIEDIIDFKKFSYGANSFFQINQIMLDLLIEDFKTYIPFDKQKTIVDLYCGVGLFAIIFSGLVKSVFAVESSVSSSLFLKKNLADNKISNISTAQSDCEQWIINLKQIKPDILIIDPPRKGLTNIIIEQLIKIPPEFIAYVSCDPVTLARDLKKLIPTYSLVHTIAYDFFPQTGHIETLAILKKTKQS
ncbi:MAG: 23S rRNA (uracil(1939)-C(5))-methyltransferase RlmD [Candidatus Omnitrophica bacterium]|nr:23S rRNA (uracil(1939)-C(5))-methyltransferase RlmD [Candidatus Omnitrophota bacterium]